MAYDVRQMVAEAERMALPFMARPINMYRCPTHPERELELNWARLLICNHPSHRPNRGDDEE